MSKQRPLAVQLVRIRAEYAANRFDEEGTPFDHSYDVFDSAINQVRAEAWDEGWAASLDDSVTGDMTINPYYTTGQEQT